MVMRDLVLIHHKHNDRALRLGLSAELAQHGERREQTRYADRKARRRHRLAPETGDQAVIPPATRHRAETHRSAVIALHFECEFSLENGAGVIFEATDDGRVNHHASVIISASGNKRAYIGQFGYTFCTNRRA